MARPGEARLGAAALVAIGALWLALTGLCTASLSGAGNLGSAWPIGLWFMSIGVLPLAHGLKSFTPPRPLGWGLCVAGAAWLAGGLVLLALSVRDEILYATVNIDVSALFFVLWALFFWAIFQAPGAWMLLGGMSMLRAARKAARSDSQGSAL